MSSEVEEPIKVLYVEDDLIDQKAFQRSVKAGHMNIDAELASSVSEAKEKLADHDYDVVVTDYMLNNETGFNVVDAVKNTPVIFLTGQGDQKIAVQAMKKGVFDYILKETSGSYLDLLFTTIEKAYQHHNTQKKLTQAEKEINKLVWTLGQIKNSIMILTKTGEIEWVNKGFENLYGYTLEEVKGKNIFKAHEISKRTADLEKLFATTLREKKNVTYESEITNKKGDHFWIYTNISPAIEESGEVNSVIIVDTDISEKKKTEQELIIAKEKAEVATVTKQQFLANMSHEIRTPINAIMGIMHILESTEHPEERKKYLKLVNSASNNLLNIINDILDISKLEVGKMVIEKINFNIYDLVSNLRESMKYRAEEKGLQLKCHIENDVPHYVKGDPSRLNQILMNLVGNSIKFTRTGHITITVKSLSQSGSKVKLLFTVTDTGIGIPEDAQSHLFEYFHQVHSDANRQYGGTGLGLAIVKRLTEVQKGKVWFKSKENEGSDFYVELEFETGSAIKQEATKEPTETHGKFLKGKKILLVEDEALNQMVAKHLLETEMGATIELAKNGRIAIEQIEKTDFDLVLMDIQMPEMNGYEATDYIRNKLPSPKNKVPIMAMTAHAFNEEKEKCLQAGMNDFISKPLKIDEFKQKLQRIFTGIQE